MKFNELTTSLKKIYSTQKILFWSAISLLLYTTFLRFCALHQFLPYIHLDENELIEFPLAMFGPDKDPHWYKYGPLYWYVMKIIYSIQIAFSGLTTDQFVENYFMDSSSYFLSSRRLSTFLQIVIAFVAFFSAKILNKKAALLAFIIAIIPVGDLLTGFYPRIDVMLAIWSAIALLVGLKIVKAKTQAHWALYAIMGFAYACSFSSKPIPSLLILPALGLVFYFSSYEVKKKNLIQPIIRIVTSKGLYIFLIFILIGSYLTNPYAFKSFDAFWAEQVKAVQEEGGRNFAAGSDLTRFRHSFGYPYLILAIIATLYSIYSGLKRNKFGLIVLAVYVLTYWGAFAMGAARNYFYVPLIMPLAVVTAYQLRRLLKKLCDSRKLKLSVELISAICLITLMALPLIKSSQDRISKLTADNQNDHTITAAEKYISTNVPANSKILYYGYYTNLPSLMDIDLNEQARYGEYFMYGRGKNQYWIDRYSTAYRSIRTNPTMKMYDIIYNLNIPNGNGQNTSYYTRYSNESVSQNIFTLAQSNNIPYIVTHYDLPKQSGNYELVGNYGKGSLNHGSGVFVYKMKRL